MLANTPKGNDKILPTVSRIDPATVKTKSYKFLKTLNDNQLDNLIVKYNIHNYNLVKDSKVRSIYTNGVGFRDVIYAIHEYFDMIEGVIPYHPKPGEIISGIYEPSGKVEKNYKDLAEPIPGRPYTYLTPSDLRDIMNERDIDPGNNHSVVRAEILRNYDLVIPDWTNDIMIQPLQNLHRLKLCYRLARLNVKYTDIDDISTPEIRDIIQALEIIMVGSNRKSLPPRLNPIKYIGPVLDYEQAYNIVNMEGKLLDPINIGFTLIRSGVEISTEDLVNLLNQLASNPSHMSNQEFKTITEINMLRVVELIKNNINIFNLNGILFDDLIISKHNILFLITRGYPNIQEINRVKNRYQIINTYDENVINKLANIYNVVERRKTRRKKEIAGNQLNPLETILINYNKTITDLIDRLVSQNVIDDMITMYSNSIGMIIPLGFDKLTYFWDNLHHYRDIMTRRNDIGKLDKDLLSPGILTGEEVTNLIKKYTDSELFHYTGAFLPYQNREEILDNILRLRRGNHFFIPTVRACTNRETITGLENTDDQQVFIVAYGNLFRYYCYDLDDFMENFTEYPIEGIDKNEFRFRIPQIPEEDFPTLDIEELLKILIVYNMDEAVSKIRDGLVKVRKITQYDKKVRNIFNTLSDKDKSIIKRWFYQLFYTGMYMRRWKGPPHPYPTEEQDTQGEDPNIKVNEQLQILGYYPKINNTPKDFIGITAELSPEAIDFVDGLKITEYRLVDNNEGLERNIREPVQKTMTIGYELNKVRHGEACIRLASTNLIGSAYYYLDLFYYEQIPNFNPRDLERIV
jgi:hypothetical protein